MHMPDKQVLIKIAANQLMLVIAGIEEIFPTLYLPYGLGGGFSRLWRMGAFGNPVHQRLVFLIRQVRQAVRHTPQGVFTGEFVEIALNRTRLLAVQGSCHTRGQDTGTWLGVELLKPEHLIQRRLA